MLAGVFSSILCITKDSFELALPGLVLGGLLSVGISLINYSYGKSLNQGIPPGVFGVLGYTALVGALAAVYMDFFCETASATVTPDAMLRFNPQAPVFALVYAFTLLPIYYVRFGVRKNSGIILLTIGLASLFAGFSLIIISRISSGYNATLDGLIQISTFVAVFKVIPFVWLWFFSVCLFDPAFTLARWQRTTGNVKTDADAVADTI
jgi:hypothetical protein